MELQCTFNIQLADTNEAQQFATDICSARGYAPVQMSTVPYWKIEGQQQVRLVLPLYAGLSLEEAIAEVQRIAVGIAPQGWGDTGPDTDDEVVYEMVLDLMEQEGALKWTHLQLVID